MDGRGLQNIPVLGIWHHGSLVAKKGFATKPPRPYARMAGQTKQIRGRPFIGFATTKGICNMAKYKVWAYVEVIEQVGDYDFCIRNESNPVMIQECDTEGEADLVMHNVLASRMDMR